MKQTVDILRILYAIKYKDGIPVYQLDFEVLDQYLNDSKLPPKNFQVPTPQIAEEDKSDEDDSEGDVDESPIKISEPGLSMSFKVSFELIISFN